MKLTKKKAIEISIELWTFLAETGGQKLDWNGWNKYGYMSASCPLCEYSRGLCKSCPYYKKFKPCCSLGDKPVTIYDYWEAAKTLETRKKYAKLFLEQLKEL